MAVGRRAAAPSRGAAGFRPQVDEGTGYIVHSYYGYMGSTGWRRRLHISYPGFSGWPEQSVCRRGGSVRSNWQLPPQCPQKVTSSLTDVYFRPVSELQGCHRRSNLPGWAHSRADGRLGWPGEPHAWILPPKLQPQARYSA